MHHRGTVRPDHLDIRNAQHPHMAGFQLALDAALAKARRARERALAEGEDPDDAPMVPVHVEFAAIINPGEIQHYVATIS